MSHPYTGGDQRGVSKFAFDARQSLSEVWTIVGRSRPCLNTGIRRSAGYSSDFTTDPTRDAGGEGVGGTGVSRSTSGQVIGLIGLHEEASIPLGSSLVPVPALEDGVA